MPTFLESHFKIQQLESYLTKNEYLSDECLPNYIDAEVFKALKTSQSIFVLKKEEIPKRQIYPNLYHWYVLMRQFSDRTLEIWLKDRSMESKKNKIIREVVGVINENKRKKSQKGEDNPQKIVSLSRPVSNSSSFFVIDVIPISSQQCVSSRELLQIPATHIMDLPKMSSHIVKKPATQFDTINQYIMDVKLNSQGGISSVRKLFEIETQFICQQRSVKLESIKTIGTNQDRMKSVEIRLFFLTVSHVCEELKNRISACACVQSIQCKKSKRNQSL